jgi:small subunit ribosomal protein S25e
VPEKRKIRGSLARRALRELEEKGLLRKVVAYRAQFIFTKVTKETEDEKAE